MLMFLGDAQEGKAGGAEEMGEKLSVENENDWDKDDGSQVAIYCTILLGSRLCVLAVCFEGRLNNECVCAGGEEC